MNGEFSKTKSKGRPPASPRSYLAGLLSGIFLSCLMYFGLAPSEVPSEQTKPGGKGTSSDVEVDAPTYTFYGTLTDTDYVWGEDEDKVDDPVDSSAAAQPEKYFVLQAGSFRQEEDADTRRAELIILGLHPTIEKGKGDQGLWRRVFLGPFKSKSEVLEARGLAASQDIDTMIIKREGRL
jgi:cell division protein FtsN